MKTFYVDEIGSNQTRSETYIQPFKYDIMYCKYVKSFVAWNYPMLADKSGLFIYAQYTHRTKCCKKKVKYKKKYEND